MGLDMYFKGQRRLYSFDKNDSALSKEIAEKFPEVRGAFPDYVQFELKYWRKANAIHKWFVTNVQEGEDNCEEHYVEIKQLYDLQDRCTKIHNDRSLAPDLLPTCEGFFFGSSEYNENYFNEIEQTMKWLNGFLVKDAFEIWKKWDFYYRSSW